MSAKRTKTLRALLAMVISIVAFSLLTFLGLYGLPAKVQYTITERYRFDVKETPTTVYLGAVLPRTGPYQTVSEPNIVWDEQIESIEDEALIHLHLSGDVQSGDEASISFKVTLPQGWRRWDALVAETDLSPQPNIESDDSHFFIQATLLSGGHANYNPYNIYAFVAENVNWPTGTRINEDPSALKTLYSYVGGCNEFANLAVALYRSLGTPARTISGLAMPMALPYSSQTSEWLHPAGSHAWIEVQTPRGWHMADPSWGSRWGIFRRLYWGRNDGQHLSYGEIAAHDTALAALRAWAEDHGPLIGAMSGPNRFAVSAASAGVSVTPIVTVQKGWDGRWFNVILLWALGIFAVVKLSTLVNKAS